MKNQLLFLWIDQTTYTCFSNTNFCFSSVLDIKFDKENAVLNIQKLNNIDIFKDIKGISNITAVVGNNGAGKSTLLKFLLNLNNYSKKTARLLRRDSFDKRAPIFFITVHLIDNRLVISNYTDKRISVNNGDNHFEVEKTSRVEDGYDIGSLSTIYLSLDSREDIKFDQEENNFIPLTAKSIDRLRRLFIKNRRCESLSKVQYNSESFFDFENFVVTDFYTSNFSKNLLTRNMDDGVIVKLMNTGFSPKYIFDEYFEVRDRLLLRLIKELGLENNFNHTKINDEIISSFLYESLENGSIVDADYYFKALEEIEFFTTYASEMSGEDEYYLRLDKARELIDMIKADSYSFIFKYISFEFTKSDGEISYLKHLAYLYFLPRYEFGINFLVNRDVLIMIDEIDVHLHPEWQRQLINNSINVLTKLFENKNVQIVLTTHSPIVLSDLPTQNIIFVSKKENCESNVFKRDQSEYRTFGANIFDLYNDSFFFDGDAIVGDYAKNYINSIYTQLETMSESSKETILKKIELVGEPVIKNDLLYLFNGKQVIDETESLSKKELLKILYEEKDRILKLIKEMENN